MIRKVLSWTLVVFLVFYVVTRPAAAAHSTKGIGNGLIHVGNSIATFASEVTK